MAPIASLLMFSTVMIEFHYVITSVWRSYVLGMFVFIFLNINLMIIVISVISILCTYLQLQSGNWAWWWRSFFTGLSVGLWVFMYIMWHGIVEFKLANFGSVLVYLLYSILFSQMFGLMCAMVSVMASWFFVTFLYMQSKSD